MGFVVLLVLPVYLSTATALAVFFILGVWLAISLTWAPFGGILLVAAAPDRASLARKDKMRRFALGFVASALFLLPWIYLVLRANGRAVNSRWPRTAYQGLYTTWGLIALQPLTLFLALGALIVVSGFRGLGSVAGLYAGAFLILCLFAWTLLRSYRSLRSQWREDTREADTDEKGYPAIDFHKAAYLKPFLWTYLWTALGSLYHWGLVVPQACAESSLSSELTRNLIC